METTTEVSGNPNDIPTIAAIKDLVLKAAQNGEITWKQYQDFIASDPAPPTDPGYCGITPFVTGKYDPWWKIWCVKHDNKFNQMAAGTYEGSGFKVAAESVVEIAQGMVAGAYLLVSGIPYLLVGGILGGLTRWGYLERQTNRAKPYLGTPDNTPVNPDFMG